jgi:hypothetical protein
VRGPERPQPVPDRRTRPLPWGAVAQGGQSGGVASGNPKGGGARPAWDWDPRRSDAPEKAAGLVPPAVFPLWPCSILKGGIRKGGFQRGKTEGGNGLVGAARRVGRERSDRSSSEAVPAEHHL